MKNLQLYMLIVLLCVYNSYPVFSFERPPQVFCPFPQHVKTGKPHESVPLPEQQFVGNISAALISADHVKTDDAIAYLGLAKQNISDVKKAGFKKIERMRVGYLDYIILPHEGQQYTEERHALFPFEAGTFAVYVPEMDKRTEKYLKISLRDARVEFVDMDWNVAEIRLDLDTAIIALSHRNPVSAAHSLLSILDKDIAVTKGTEGETLQSAYDHIMLANGLLQSKDYSFASYALYHAQLQLRQYNACNPVAEEGQVRLLGNEIQKVSQELKKGNPSVFDKVRENMRHWADTLQKWMNAAPELGRS